MKNHPLLHTSTLLLLVIGIQFYFLYQAHQANKSLIQSIALLETSFEKERSRNQQQFDSLQAGIIQQSKYNRKIRNSLKDLQQLKSANTITANEKKNTVRRIRALDSLRREVTRHYKR